MRSAGMEQAHGDDRNDERPQTTGTGPQRQVPCRRRLRDCERLPFRNTAAVPPVENPAFFLPDPPSSMADIELTRSHSMNPDEARTAVERVARELETDLEVDYEWDGDTLLFDGPGADGKIEIETDAIQVLIDLSAFLRPMKSRVESEAATYLDRYLDETAS